jgi:hypothetical protein
VQLSPCWVAGASSCRVVATPVHLMSCVYSFSHRNRLARVLPQQHALHLCVSVCAAVQTWAHAGELRAVYCHLVDWWTLIAECFASAYSLRVPRIGKSRPDLALSVCACTCQLCDGGHVATHCLCTQLVNGIQGELNSSPHRWASATCCLACKHHAAWHCMYATLATHSRPATAQ